MIKISRKITALAVLSFSCYALAACNNSSKRQEDVKKGNQELNFIFPKGEPGATNLFTGKAHHTSLLADDSVYTTTVGNVYFEPGARSNWHSHPSGQILIITDGRGYHQIEGKPVETIKKGDIVRCPPNVRHWHGASPKIGLQQLYIIPNTENGVVDWMEPVSDEVYQIK